MEVNEIIDKYNPLLVYRDKYRKVYFPVNLPEEERKMIMENLDAISKELERRELRAKIEEAKRLGQPVVVSRIALDYKDMNISTERDIIVTYAFPDGAIQQERVHTF